jgi:hypothetical protein
MSKALKRRDCPAVGRQITSLECGQNRIVHYACPATCVHNPFAPAQYRQLLDLESKVDTKGFQWLLTEHPEKLKLENDFKRALQRNNQEGAHALVEWHLYFQKNPCGLTCAQRWEKAGFGDLKTDEKTLFRAKMKSRVALLEIHRVLEGDQTEAVDLLDPEGPPLIIQDISLASSAVRFVVLLTWLYPLPHFWRISGTAAPFPELAPFDPTTVFRELIRHLGGPIEGPEARRWLAEHFVKFSRALHATGLARRQLMIASMDACFGKITYELLQPFDECRRVLDAIPEVDEDALSPEEAKEEFVEARVWFEPNPTLENQVTPASRRVMGRVLLNGKRWRLEALGGARLTDLRALFEKLLGSRVRFLTEERDDLTSRLERKSPLYDHSLVPPALLQHPEQIRMASSRTAHVPEDKPFSEMESHFLAQTDREFLDHPLPVLENRTPRQAAGDPSLRPKLIQLLKSRVRSCDEMQRDKDVDYDVNWMLRELGLHEILFDPPPPRTPRRADGGSPFVEGSETTPQTDSERPPPPPLPDQPLSYDEAARRLQHSLDTFETAAQSMTALQASGATLLEDAEVIASNYISPDEFAFLVPRLMQLWFALIPPDARAPLLPFDDLADAFDRELERFVSALYEDDSKLMEKHIGESRQPALASLVISGLLNSIQRTPLSSRPSVSAQPVMIALAKALIEQLDRMLR